MTHIIHRNPKANLPVAVSGSGCFITDANGKRYYDACGGAAVSAIGHAHPAVLEAMENQARQLEYAHTSFFTSDAAESLATHLARHTPSGLGNVYFLSSGSEAVETALKMARQYHVDNGQPLRSRFIARKQSYHGNSLGALSIGGNLARRALYEPLLMEAIHVSPCFPYRYRAEGESDASYASRLAQELEQTILQTGPEQIAAFVAETVVGATAGAVAPVAGYFEKVREICDRYGVLLIMDEIMCGLGRTGTLHAFEQEAVAPDLLCLAKGLGGGYQPIAAVIAQDFIVEKMQSTSGAFQHGHTYVGHPVACAAALATQQVIQQQSLVSRSQTLGTELHDMLRATFGQHPKIGDIRGRGLFQAIELVRDRESGEPFDASLKIAQRIKGAAFERGLLCYPGSGTIDGTSGDHILLAPPYVTTTGELQLAVDLLAGALDDVMHAIPA